MFVTPLMVESGLAAPSRQRFALASPRKSIVPRDARGLVIQVDGEPIPNNSYAEADLHLLSGGSNIGPSAFFSPLLIQET